MFPRSLNKLSLLSSTQNNFKYTMLSLLDFDDDVRVIRRIRDCAVIELLDLQMLRRVRNLYPGLSNRLVIRPQLYIDDTLVTFHPMNYSTLEWECDNADLRQIIKGIVLFLWRQGLPVDDGMDSGTLFKITLFRAVRVLERRLNGVVELRGGRLWIFDNHYIDDGFGLDIGSRRGSRFDNIRIGERTGRVDMGVGGHGQTLQAHDGQELVARQGTAGRTGRVLDDGDRVEELGDLGDDQVITFGNMGTTIREAAGVSSDQPRPPPYTPTRQNTHPGDNRAERIDNGRAINEGLGTGAGASNTGRPSARPNNGQHGGMPNAARANPQWPTAEEEKRMY
jgi:hypothetical protein